MGFEMLDGQDPHGQVRLTPVSRDRFKLVDAFRYVDGAGATNIPAHPPGGPPFVDANSTDLATIPWFLSNLLGRYGRQTFPALLHDHQCVLVDELKQAAEKAPTKEGSRDLIARAWEDRGAADRQFAEALKSQDTSWIRRNELWAGVTLGKYLGGKRPFLLLLMLFHIVCGLGPWFLVVSWLGWLTSPLPVLVTAVFGLGVVLRWFVKADPISPDRCLSGGAAGRLQPCVQLDSRLAFPSWRVPEEGMAGIFNPTKLDYHP